MPVAQPVPDVGVTPSPSCASVAFKSAVVHTVTYFIAGLVALFAFDYAALFAEPPFRYFMRQTTEPIVMAGPLFQPIRGLLFGCAFYLVREVVFRPRGWIAIWTLLVVLGILSTFGPSPGSIEGLIYTTIPLAGHLRGLPEVVGQALLYALLLHAWVTTRHRWLGRALVAAFIVALLLPAVGLILEFFE